MTTGLECFNNFYYCRFMRYHTFVIAGQNASIISTIVDSTSPTCWLSAGQNASIISTIVDSFKCNLSVFRLECFNNFYYCRSNGVQRKASIGARMLQ